MLGDDALVYSHRLSEWCSRAPDLEEDIALANIALDLLGQARLLLARAAAADPAVVPGAARGLAGAARGRAGLLPRRRRVPQRPAGRAPTTATSPRRSSGCWCSRRGGSRCCERLRRQRDPVLAAIAAKGVKELTYHRDYAGRWFLTLAQGTEESRRRLLAALDAVWPFHDELVRRPPGRGATPPRAASASTRRAVADEVDAVLEQVFAISGVERPDRPAGRRRRRSHRPRRAAHRGAEPAARRDAGRRPRPPDGAVVTPW